MKLCPECGAASKETANFCTRCKCDMQKVVATQTCYVMVDKANNMVGDYYFGSIKTLIKFLDNLHKETNDYHGMIAVHCFLTQLLGDEEFEPMETYEIRVWGMYQYFMPSQKIVINTPSKQDGFFTCPPNLL